MIGKDRCPICEEAGEDQWLHVAGGIVECEGCGFIWCPSATTIDADGMVTIHKSMPWVLAA